MIKSRRYVIRGLNSFRIKYHIFLYNNPGKKLANGCGRMAIPLLPECDVKLGIRAQAAKPYPKLRAPQTQCWCGKKLLKLWKEKLLKWQQISHIDDNQSYTALQKHLSTKATLSFFSKTYTI